MNIENRAIWMWVVQRCDGSISPFIYAYEKYARIHAEQHPGSVVYYAEILLRKKARKK